MTEPELLDGKYRIVRELRAGIFEAVDVDLDRRIALKIGAAETKERFLTEARAAAQLESRHVARVHRVGELAAGRPYVVMELLTGRTVADVLAGEGKIERRLAVDWMLQALAALAEAHATGLVHRDVRPSNLHLAERPGRSPIVKLLGFRLATDATDARLDVRAVRTTLRELLGGELPSDLDAIVRNEGFVDARALSRTLEGVREKKAGLAWLFAASMIVVTLAGVVAWVAWPRRAPHVLAAPTHVAITPPIVDAAPAESVAPAESAEARPPASPSPLHISIKSSMGFDYREAGGAWLASVRAGIERCARRSNCAGKGMSIYVPAKGVIQPTLDKCSADHSSLACFEHEIGDRRTFAPKQTEPAGVGVVIRF